ncbi:hypothetical protein HAX54_018927 [Datura stramonium]|uniref:dihydropyrimidine dehydrogenase (NADP(+)) n=1 Tax=Datura stramonium TaxID=4076 RepID=A0ABS8S1J3_DATST|nr:hypothetical protein [Datura stramonium]
MISSNSFSTVCLRYSTPGGYSSKAVHPIALAKVMNIARMMKSEFGDKDYSLSAIGGVETGGDAAEFILLGANTVQVCTVSMMHGYGLVKTLCSELQDFMRKHNFSSIEDFRGTSLEYFTTHGFALASPHHPSPKPQQLLTFPSQHLAVSENKERISKEEGRKKKAADPYIKKDWYDIKAPSVFEIKNVGKTLVTRTQGTKDILHCFTKEASNQQKRTCYAQSSQIRQIRRKMVEIMRNQASSCDLKELVAKFIPESIGRDIESSFKHIPPAKCLHSKEDVGVKLDRPADETVAEAEPEVPGA